MTSVTGKDAIKKIKKLGGIIVSQSGSHVKVMLNDKKSIIPLHGNKDLSIGVVKAIEKQLGIRLK